ncbi:MAG: preprotein translocase subunit YajC [Buchnera aphidicola (Brevicoryne brassicae)]|uniref:Sec translocon accessory complex subunit YajC n=1 Tax=Buchnera aphidicola (Brevicoryne brassicae) TaxID=911343 RepID=A0AAJ5TXG3_9GAMM|nr:preprotein translocase subunit YajC [Buchnera aphidicola]QCI19713.1 preprotein translocase subunit YajC [Buchnera aphidicola (Brevicoryne brassicae)]WAI19082.1 MAG: preprotein translocase subunit YajC [Buchnera aphidicola (Brevicoryne brassicae)]
MSFFVHNANAIVDESSKSNSYSLIFMLVIFVLIFYFMLFRPQQQKDKEHKNLINSLTQGDEVITTSGLLGRVNKITKNGYILLQLNDTTEVFIKRDFIASSLPKGTLKSL